MYHAVQNTEQYSTDDADDDVSSLTIVQQQA